MTIQEVSQKYGYSESTIANKWKRTQEAILKKYDILIRKTGKGQKAVYTECKIIDDKRQDSLYKENKEEIALSAESLRMINWDFLVFLTIVTTPLCVFRGDYKTFLSYIDLKPTPANINALKTAINNLVESNYIIYEEDKSTNEGYFILSLKRKVEKDMSVSISTIRQCKEIADNHNKRSWVPLLKTWVGIKVLEENQPFTNRELQTLTGLSEDQILKSKKMLAENEKFLISKAYTSHTTCIGQNVTMNAFYN